jgi:F420H(2)-dependent biliverdin reductase
MRGKTGGMSRLDEERNIWLATTRPDGRPHLTPIWFVFVDGRFWVGTGASSVKVGNLAANPKVSVSLESGDRPVVAEGTVTVHAGGVPSPVAEAFGSKFAWDVTVDDPEMGPVVILEISVDRWLMGDPSSELA